ncbi:hypothetical protein PFISCL1PPCAC_18978, partial [Pristionchus fissidentatus]
RMSLDSSENLLENIDDKQQNEPFVSIEIEGPPEKRRKMDEKSLLDLPNEIIENIFSHLEFADRSRLRVIKRLSLIESTIRAPRSHYESLTMKCPSVDEARAVIEVTGSGKWNLQMSSNSLLSSLHRIIPNCLFTNVVFTIDFSNPIGRTILGLVSRVHTGSFIISSSGTNDLPFIDYSRICNLRINKEFLQVDIECEVTMKQITRLRNSLRSFRKSGGLKLVIPEDVALTLRRQYSDLNQDDNWYRMFGWWTVSKKFGNVTATVLSRPVDGSDQFVIKLIKTQYDSKFPQDVRDEWIRQWKLDDA